MLPKLANEPVDNKVALVQYVVGDECAKVIDDTCMDDKITAEDI